MKYSTKQDIGTFGYIILMWTVAIMFFINGDWFSSGIFLAFGLIGFIFFRIFDMNDKLRDAVLVLGEGGQDEN